MLSLLQECPHLQQSRVVARWQRGKVLLQVLSSEAQREEREGEEEEAQEAQTQKLQQRWLQQRG